MEKPRLVDDVPPYTFDEVVFLDETRSGRLMLGLFRKIDPDSILTLRLKPRHPMRRTPGVVALGQICGLTEPIHARLLAEHGRRLGWRAVWDGLIKILLVTVVSFATAVPILTLFDVGFRQGLLSESNDIFVPLLVLMVIVQIFSQLFAILVTVRLFQRLTSRFFANSLCVMNVLLLNIELRREAVLEFPDHRLAIVRRLRALQHTTQLLVLWYGTMHPETHKRLRQHFGAVVKHLRECEYWASVPGKSTVENLRRDVAELTEMFVTGQYGTFAWNPTEPHEEEFIRGRTVWRAAAKGAAFIVPLAFMFYLLVTPKILAAREIPATAVAALFMSWLLLGLDNLLNLGVVANVAALAKGIKELK